MNDDYLWDGSGRPDADVERLEQLLRPLRTAPPPLVTEGRAGTPAAAPGPARRAGPTWRGAAGLDWREVLRAGSTWRITIPLLAAAALLLAFLLPQRVGRPAERPQGWAVVSVEGTPQVEGKSVTSSSQLHVGQTVTTDAQSRVRIAGPGVGEILVDPLSRLRLVAAGPNLHRLALDRGALQASIVSPPGHFVVETPTATAVDLGCVYTLRVDQEGSGVLSVQAGWVGFEFQGRESFVPAGAWCPTSGTLGLGLPRFEDATPAFLQALAVLEKAGIAEARATGLSGTLSSARERDAFTLWHLLQVVPPRERESVYAVLARLAPPPATVTREEALRLDRAALDAWWDSLGLGDVGLWRAWKRRVLQ